MKTLNMNVKIPLSFKEATLHKTTTYICKTFFVSSHSLKIHVRFAVVVVFSFFLNFFLSVFLFFLHSFAVCIVYFIFVAVFFKTKQPHTQCSQKTRKFGKFPVSWWKEGKVNAHAKDRKRRIECD